MRSSVTLRSSVDRGASGDGSIFSRRSRARMNASTGVRTQSRSAAATAGTAGFLSGRNDQWPVEGRAAAAPCSSGNRAPASIHARSADVSARVSFRPAGGILPPSTIAISLLAAASPGTITAPA